VVGGEEKENAMQKLLEKMPIRNEIEGSQLQAGKVKETNKEIDTKKLAWLNTS